MTLTIKTFVDQLCCPAGVIAKDLTIEYANNDLCHLVKLLKKSLKDKPSLRAYLALDIFSSKQKIVTEILKNKTPQKFCDVMGKKPDGTSGTYTVSLIPTVLLDENSASIILIVSETPIPENDPIDFETKYLGLKTEFEKVSRTNKQLAELVETKSLELKKAYSEFNQELEIARTVQNGLLPKELPNLLGMRTASRYIPTGKVGGDLFDIIITKDRKIAVLIFDVSGHGVPAALIAAMGKMLFSYYIEKGHNPAEIFSKINKRLSSYIQTGHYITAFLGIIDPSNNSMVYSRAGHCKPILYHSNSKKISLLKGDSIFLGHPALLNIATYRNDKIFLHWNDKLLLYTDGITESVNEKGEMYTQDKLNALVNEFSTLSPEKLITKILKDNDQFRNGTPLEDDLSLLCIQIGCDESLLDESGFTIADVPGVISFSSHEEIEGICSIILRELDKKGYPTQHFFQAHLCMHEMLSNAIRHGNHYDINKKAIVLYKVSLDSLAISVIDEGKGFNYSKLPDPLAETNLTKDHGRGLFLVKNYMDVVEFNAKGNRIKAVKYLKQGF